MGKRCKPGKKSCLISLRSVERIWHIYCFNTLEFITMGSLKSWWTVNTKETSICPTLTIVVNDTISHHPIFYFSTYPQFQFLTKGDSRIINGQHLLFCSSLHRNVKAQHLLSGYTIEFCLAITQDARWFTPRWKQAQSYGHILINDSWYIPSVCQLYMATNLTIILLNISRNP